MTWGPGKSETLAGFPKHRQLITLCCAVEALVKMPPTLVVAKRAQGIWALVRKTQGERW